jgi:hypothetical protein
MTLKLEEGGFYFDGHGQVRGPMMKSQSNAQGVQRFAVVADGRLLVYMLDGRFEPELANNIHAMHLRREAYVIGLPADREIEGGMSDNFGHFLEAVNQLIDRQHFDDDLDNDMVWFTMKGFDAFCKTFRLLKPSDPEKEMQFALDLMAHKRGTPMVAYLKPDDGSFLDRHNSERFKSKPVDMISEASGIMRQQADFDKASEDRVVLEAGLKTAVIPEPSPSMDYRKKLIERIADMFGVPHHLLYRQPTEGQIREIERRREEYNAAAKAIRSLGINLENFRDSFAVVQEAIAAKIAAELTLKPGPGVSRKGLPLIGSHWIRRGTKKVFEVVKITGEGINTVVHVGNPHAPGDTSIHSMFFLHSWNRAMEFKRYAIPTDHSLLYAGPSRKPIKRVYWEPVLKSFYRRSANGKTMYRMSFEFNEAWKHRAEEYPRCSLAPDQNEFLVGPPKIVIGPVRLSFPELGKPFVPKTPNPLCGVAGEDLKTGDVVQFDDDGTLKKATASEEETRQRADEALKKADAIRNTHKVTLDASSITDEARRKIEEAMGAIKPFPKVANYAMPFTGYPLERMEASVLNFLNRIGEYNGLGKVSGVMQHERNKLRVEYRNANGGAMTVDFEMPYPLTVPLMGY